LEFKFHLYSLKVYANVKIAMQCFEIFGGQMPSGCASVVSHMICRLICDHEIAWTDRAVAGKAWFGSLLQTNEIDLLLTMTVETNFFPNIHSTEIKMSLSHRWLNK